MIYEYFNIHFMSFNKDDLYHGARYKPLKKSCSLQNAIANYHLFYGGLPKPPTHHCVVRGTLSELAQCQLGRR